MASSRPPTAQDSFELHAAEGMDLDTQVIRAGLNCLGKHPISQSHCFLGLNVSNKNIRGTSALKDYTKLVYLDISKNKIESLQDLNGFDCLVQLNASENNLLRCLDLSIPKCTPSNAWPGGGRAIGSMLTLVDLSKNHITEICDLSPHSFLECLLLNENKISRISGLSGLKYLKVLNLSKNNLSNIEGLNEAPALQELDLSFNKLSRLYGLDNLSQLSVLNVSDNQIVSLGPLSSCQSLYSLNVSNNLMTVIRQVEFLQDLPFLNTLHFKGNPCSGKSNYRLRTIFRLKTLEYLDEVKVNSNEIVLSNNLYRSKDGDIGSRDQVHYKHFEENFVRLTTKYRQSSANAVKLMNHETMVPDFENFGVILEIDEEAGVSAQELYDGNC